MKSPTAKTIADLGAEIKNIAGKVSAGRERVEATRREVRAAKTEFKVVRKRFKRAKKAAKEARKETKLLKRELKKATLAAQEERARKKAAAIRQKRAAAVIAPEGKGGKSNLVVHPALRARFNRNLVSAESSSILEPARDRPSRARPISETARESDVLSVTPPVN